MEHNKKEIMNFKIRNIMVIGTFITIGAHATLGEHVDSVSADAKVFKIQSKVSSRSQERFAVHEIAYGPGFIKQFANSDGKIFAIVWEGLRTPDLTQLLGNYYDDYEQNLQGTKRIFGQRFQNVRGRNVVVEKWGVMRRLQGRAYDPFLMPEGVSIREIK